MTTTREQTITSRQVKEQQAGATQVAPGVWMDAEGYMHISIPDVLQYFGLPDTPEMRTELTERVSQMLTEECGMAEIVVQSVQDA